MKAQDINMKTQDTNVKHRRKKIFNKIILEVIVFTFALIWFIPLYATAINSFKLHEDVVRQPFTISLSTFTLDNYINILTNKSINVLDMYKNSLITTVISVGLLAIMTPMAGYYIARASDKAGKRWMMYFLLGLMISNEVILIPLASTYRDLGLIGSNIGLIIFFLGSHNALSVFLYYKFIKTIPKEIEESAYIDGAKSSTIFWRVMYPLLKPCTATVLVMVGLIVWNNFLVPLVLLGYSKGATITLGIFRFKGLYESDYGSIFTFVVLASLPLIILFLSLQDWFISDLTKGAVKG
jgi:raffinose/stachyose/melibiose transport system permease protein